MAQYTTTTHQTIPFPYTALGQELIIIASCVNAVAAEQNVKFVCEISVNAVSIGTFKTTPNNAGVGVFDVSTLWSNYVKADNISQGRYTSFKSQYAKGKFPIHLIDKFSLSTDSLSSCVASFSTQFTAADGSIQETAQALACDFVGFNGYSKNTDVLY